MSYQRDREDFLLTLAREGVPAAVSRTVLRHTNTLQRLSVEACNRTLTHQEHVRDGRATTAIRLALEPYGVTPIFSGDPRGACVKLQLPSGRTDDWGQTGLCVPTRRY